MKDEDKTKAELIKELKTLRKEREKGVFKNIGEYKKVSKWLKESEKKYRTVFENTSIVTMVIEEDKTISMVNTQGEKLSGYSIEEIENKMKWTDFVILEDLKRMKKYHIARRKPGEKTPTEYEFRMIDKKGNVKDMFLKIGIIPGTKKSVASLIDITERKQAEDALRESEEKYCDMAEFFPEVVYECDARGNFTFANKVAFEKFGFTREDFDKGVNALRLIAPDDRKRTGEDIGKILHGTERGPFEYIAQRKDGFRFPVITYLSPITRDGKPVGFRGIVIDITERKQAEENLKNAKNELQMIMDSVPAIITYKDTESKIIRANKTMANSLKMPIKDIIGKTTEELFPKEQAEKMRKDDREVIISGKPKRNIIQPYTTPDGIRWLTTDKIPYRDKKGKVTSVIGLSKDITVQKKSEEELQQSYQKLKKTMDAAIDTMSMIIEAKDPYTSNHQHRVCQLAVSLARELGLTEDKVEGIRIASLIHDIGKVGLPTEILSKPTKLTDIEFDLIKNHSQTGYNILKSIDFPYSVAEIVLQHHERLNGSGYPNNLKGDKILLEACILGVADVVEAISSHRPYRPALGIDVALEEIFKNRGILYDPEVVDTCLRLFKEKGFKFK